jgi:hypothetical protein
MGDISCQKQALSNLDHEVVGGNFGNKSAKDEVNDADNSTNISK